MLVLAVYSDVDGARRLEASRVEVRGNALHATHSHAPGETTVFACDDVRSVLLVAVEESTAVDAEQQRMPL